MSSFHEEVKTQREAIVKAEYVFNKLHKVLEDYDNSLTELTEGNGCSTCLGDVLKNEQAISLLEKLKSGNIAEQIEVFTEKNINEFFDSCDKYCSPKIIYPVRFILLELASFFQDLVKESGIEVEEEAMKALQGGTFRGKIKNILFGVQVYLSYQFTNVSFVTLNHLADGKPALNAVLIGFHKFNGEYDFRSMSKACCSEIQHDDSSISQDDGGFKHRVHSNEVSFPTSGFEFYFRNIPEPGTPTLGRILKDAVQQKLAQGFKYYEKIMGGSELRNNLLTTAQMYVHDSITFYMECQAINQFIEMMQTDEKIYVPTLEEAKSFSLNTLLSVKIDDLSDFAFEKMSSNGTASNETLGESVEVYTTTEMRNVISSGLQEIKKQIERIDHKELIQIAGGVISQFSEHMKYKENEEGEISMDEYAKTVLAQTFAYETTVAFVFLMYLMSLKTISLSSALFAMFKKGLLNNLGITPRIRHPEKTNSDVHKSKSKDDMKTEFESMSGRSPYNMLDVKHTFDTMKYIIGDDKYEDIEKEVRNHMDKSDTSKDSPDKYRLIFDRMMLLLKKFLDVHYETKLRSNVEDEFLQGTETKEYVKYVESTLNFYVLLSLSSPVKINDELSVADGILDYGILREQMREFDELDYDDTRIQQFDIVRFEFEDGEEKEGYVKSIDGDKYYTIETRDGITYTNIEKATFLKRFKVNEQVSVKYTGGMDHFAKITSLPTNDNENVIVTVFQNPDNNQPLSNNNEAEILKENFRIPIVELYENNEN